jgi:hypothetical protein
MIPQTLTSTDHARTLDDDRRLDALVAGPQPSTGGPLWWLLWLTALVSGALLLTRWVVPAPAPTAAPAPPAALRDTRSAGALPSPVPTPQAAPPPWYAFNQAMERCEVQDPASDGHPAQVMALLDTLGEQYTMQDVTERGAIVQTTLTVVPGGMFPEGRRIIWYRGQARCEQVHRMKQQSQEQQRSKYR